jgi:hypothetical protein
MSRQQGRGGMGSRKHGRSGRPGPPPGLKCSLARLENERRQKPKRSQKWFASVLALLRAKRHES